MLTKKLLCSAMLVGVAACTALAPAQAQDITPNIHIVETTQNTDVLSGDEEVFVLTAKKSEQTCFVAFEIELVNHVFTLLPMTLLSNQDVGGRRPNLHRTPGILVGSNVVPLGAAQYNTNRNTVDKVGWRAKLAA